MMKHIPVLLEETIKLLLEKKDGNYFDGTVGFGGHSGEILNNISTSSKLVGTDKDKDAFEFCLDRFKDDKRFAIYNTSFVNIDKIAKIEFIDRFDGILADLGVSSFQYDNPESGFTYREDAPLDLRMDKSTKINAANLINSLDENELANIFYKYGEERDSRRIARRIVSARDSKKITSTLDLKDVIEKSVGAKNLNKTLSRIFQALRIEVNNELGELEMFLENAIEILAPGGRIAIISFHSLEDRIVKEKFKFESLSCICPPEYPVCICDKKKRLKIITSKPIIASEEELKINPRSRSAKLRIAERIEDE
ncbi:MAG: 16S rRNA (cytosine(1402)-N(4))-methyltransferase RsmH [Melioribacteraceae bacterium]